MSKENECPHCGKSFKYPSFLRRHLDAKRKCVPAFLEGSDGAAMPKPYLCRFCGAGFTDINHRNRHMRVSCKIAPNARNGDSGLDRLYAHTLQKQIAAQKEENNEIKARMSRMEEMMGQLLRSQQAGTSMSSKDVVVAQGDNCVSMVDHSKIVNINVFGQERLDHVTAERIKTILDECLQRPALPAAVGEAVLKTAMLVYSDPDRPENLTAYLPNKKTKDALVHTQAGWEVQPTQLVLPPMALKSIDTIFGKQPPEDEYAPLLKELQQNEARFAAGEDLHPILVRNKDLLARALATLPVAGE